MYINVIGAGLAGCEAAWQIAKRGINVRLFEMKPDKMTPAHKSRNFAELICSNSLKADRIESAAGLLKEEMRQIGSLLMECADKCRVPAGGALAVDRDMFSSMVTEKIKSNPLIEVIEAEVTDIPNDTVTVIATGPRCHRPAPHRRWSHPDQHSRVQPVRSTPASEPYRSRYSSGS